MTKKYSAKFPIYSILLNVMYGQYIGFQVYLPTALYINSFHHLIHKLSCSLYMVLTTFILFNVLYNILSSIYLCLT